MYISVPKNYGGNAFPRPDASPGASEVPAHAFTHRSAPLPDFDPKQQDARLSPPPRRDPPRDCPPSCDPCDPCVSCEDRKPPECGRHEPEKDRCDCDGCRAKENKNPLTCLFEALRGRKKAGFDADDFLLIGLIALLMGKEGNEDIVLILALLLLV